MTAITAGLATQAAEAVLFILQFAIVIAAFTCIYRPDLATMIHGYLP